MSFHGNYEQQVALLLDVLPFVQQEACFAIKGGTAINLFVRDMPRLSVDIDLTYLPIEPRELFLANIQKSLYRLEKNLSDNHFVVTRRYTKKGNQILKLLVSNHNVTIKVEPNMVLRGAVFEPQIMSLSESVQEKFLQFQECKLLSVADLYAGKICAALDRQHPRDLFDIKLLFESEGIAERIRQAFVIYLASSPRPMYELLKPNELDIREAYQNEFSGMTTYSVSYDDLIETRSQLVTIINHSLTLNERKFLISMKQGQPIWTLLPIPNIDKLPGIKWKLFNIQKMDKKRQLSSLNALKEALEL